MNATDAIGTNRSAFFPLGIWYQGSSPFINADGTFGNIGTPPADPSDAVRYYDETLRQLKSWGINVIVHVNGDDPHALNVLDAAQRVGGIYVIHDVFKFHDVIFYPSGAQICDASKIPAAVSAAAAFSAKPALLWFEEIDEPAAQCLGTLRQLLGGLRGVDRRHGSFAAISDWNEGTDYHRHVENSIVPIIDKMTGFDAVSYDAYPMFRGVAEGDIAAFQGWIDTFDYYYGITPSDKAVYPVIQAMDDTAYRYPTPAELRFMTNASLAHGAKGIFWYIYQRLSDTPDHSAGDGGGGPIDIDFDQQSTGRALQSLAVRARALSSWLIDASRDLPAKNGRSTVATVVTENGQAASSSSYDITSFQTLFGEALVMLVSRRAAPTDPATSTFQVSVNVSTVRMQALCAKGSVSVVDVETGQLYATRTDCTIATGSTVPLTFNVSLAQGDAKLFQLQSALSADIRVPKDAYNATTGLSQSIKIDLALKNLGSATWSPSSHHVGVHVYTPDGTTIASAAALSGASFAAPVPPGGTAALTVTVPTGAGTSLTTTGSYRLGIDLYQDGVPPLWFGNEQVVGVLVSSNPLLVDTFDPAPHGSEPVDTIKWAAPSSTAEPLMTARGGALAGNGGEVALSQWGASWTDYTYEADIMIDPESAPSVAYAGWMVRASASGGGAGYMFNLSASTATVNPNSLRKHVQSGGSYSLAGIVPTGLTITPGAWYHITQILSGNTITTSIKPTGAAGPSTVIDVWTDNHFSSGGVGFRLNEGSEPFVERAHYDNVAVWRPTGSTATPAQVTGLTATGSADKIALSWARDATSNGGGVSHYRVYRSTSSGSVGSVIAEPAGASYLDGTAVPGTTFFYRASAVTADGVEGPKSVAVSGTALPLPAAVTSLVASVNSMKWVSLSWTGSAASYRIHRGPPGMVPDESNRIATVTTTSYDDTTSNAFVSDSQLGLAGFRPYAYAVVPVSASGGLGPASGVTATTSGSTLLSDGFDGAAGQWHAYTGSWAATGSSYRQSSATCGNGCIIPAMTAIDGRKFGDFVAEFTVHLDSDDIFDVTGMNWVGMTIRKPNQADVLQQSGFLILLRYNGSVELVEAGRGTVASAATAMSPAVESRRIRVEATGAFIRVLVDGVVFINYYSPSDAWLAPGYVDLTTYGVTASYQDVSVFYRDGFNRPCTFQCAPAPSPARASNWQLLPAGAAYDMSVAGQLRLNPGIGFLNWTTPAELQVSDFTADFALRVDPAGGDDTLWGGFTFRKQAPAHSTFDSGYTVLFRRNGELVLFRPGVQLASVTIPGIAPTTARNIRVRATGSRIRVYVDGALAIDATDATYSTGWVHLSAYGAPASFEFLEIY